MSWYLAVAEVICWMMVVTWPKIVAYSRAIEERRVYACVCGGEREFALRIYGTQ